MLENRCVHSTTFSQNSISEVSWIIRDAQSESAKIWNSKSFFKEQNKYFNNLCCNEENNMRQVRALKL